MPMMKAAPCHRPGQHARRGVADDRFGNSFRHAAIGKDLAEHGAERHDQANGAKRAAGPRLDRLDQLVRGHAVDETDGDRGNDQRDQGVQTNTGNNKRNEKHDPADGGGQKPDIRGTHNHSQRNFKSGPDRTIAMAPITGGTRRRARMAKPKRLRKDGKHVKRLRPHHSQYVAGVVLPQQAATWTVLRSW
ncbi:MAG: hypothetical protein PW791_13675 [Neorhizobium sp.]|nr:hypothetical protein [Neorhizobium sp.]